MCYNNSNVTLELLWRKCKENYMSDMGEKKLKYIGIGEMAKLNRTTVPTLRLYDSMGLLKPCYVDEKTHYRYYDIKQNARLDMIQYMKELGMELKEIKEVLDQKDIDQIEKILQWKKVQTIQKQKELQYKMEAINRTMSNIKRYKKSPKSGTITLEYIPERIIYAMDVDTNFYDYNIDMYELILKQLKNKLLEYKIPPVYYCNAGTIMSKENFKNMKFFSDKIFIFVDDNFPLQDCTQKIENGMYACIYIEDFDQECTSATALLDYCRKNDYEICGDYICEEIMEMHIFDSGKRSMYLRLQVPVKMDK